MRRIFLLAVVLTLFLAGCFSAEDESINITLTAISAELAQEPTNTATPVPPTSTSTTTPTPTLMPTVDLDATRGAREEATAAAAAVTATAAAPVLAELPTYGVDPTAGELAWIHPPVTISTTGYMTYTYANLNIATIAQDFAVAADITWNTRFGTTGCGFVIRSDGDPEGNYDQYIVLATRAGNGQVLFAIMQDGDTKTNEISRIVAYQIDPQFEWQNDTTNRLAVVGRGNTFSIYSNGTFLADVQPSIAYERGFIAFVALNESGDTTCHYDNTWLWLIQ
jgi:hypothetical protein